jgi:hypothetical protein
MKQTFVVGRLSTPVYFHVEQLPRASWGQRKKHPEIDASGLHFITETHAKEVLITWQVV